MIEQTEHKILVDSSHDELARQDFVANLKTSLATKLTPGVRALWDNKVGPEFEKKKGRPPKDRHEIRKAMMEHDYVKTWSAVRRTSQELLWDSVAEPVERHREELVELAKENGQKLGSITLDPDLEIPKYLTAVDIHLMPTGYYSEYGEDDVAAGAIYDRGVFVYAQGQLGPLNDNYGVAITQNYLKAKHPDFEPKAILDMGCTVGHSTLPYVDTYPNAEVHGIDIGAPLVRYGHSRAEELGKKVHFSQQNAEKTNFDDESFDLVVSHILMHETSRTALKNIFAESFRVLRAGGMMIHLEVPQYENMEPIQAFMLDWDTYNNNEPFWGAMHDTDLKQLSVNSGFESDKVSTELVPTGRKLQSGKKKQGGMKLQLTIAQK
jgi:ubiquinone/menaquinone biosynthesis C-methylase UbiE